MKFHHEGFDFHPFQIEYMIPLTDEQSDILFKPTRLVKALTETFGEQLRNVALHIMDDKSQWALYITIRSEIDTHTCRRIIATILSEHFNSVAAE